MVEKLNVVKKSEMSHHSRVIKIDPYNLELLYLFKVEQFF